jgi:head-tail adaptor
MGFAAGRRRRHRITIEALSTTTNALNEKVESWAAFKSRRCEIVWGALQERREAAQTAANQTAVFRLLADSAAMAVTVDRHRINFDGSIWNITGIADPAPDRREITAVRKAG